MKSLAALLLLLAAALPAPARAQVLVDLHVRDLDTGQWLPRHPHEGRQFIAGTPGHRYAVVLQNLSGERVLAVLSVDGVNAITGQTASPAQSGYVLGPWQRLEVRGWRKSLSEVAQFHFTSLGDSYAARTGRPGHVGVIGVAAFRERRPAPLPWADPIADAAPQARDAGAAAERADAAAAERAYAPPATRQQLGTGHGERRHDPATRVAFERAGEHPAHVLSLWYDSPEALVARGVLPAPAPWHAPEAFPIGFTPDP